GTAHNEFVAGSTYSDTATVSAADGTTQVLTVTMTGTNDAAVISGTTSGTVTEDSATTTASGTLTSTDVDGTANLFVAQTSVAGDSGYGTYTMTAGGVWTYTIDNNNATVNALNTGQTLSDTFTVTTVDGTAQTVTVAISGSTDVVSLSSITSGTGGFVINGAGLNNYSGYSVSNAGDVNGDGYDDLIIGTGTFAGTSNTGMSYVVFGGSAKTAIELSALGTTGDTNGFIINGAASAMSGWSVSGAGDVNGDGLADLIVGAKGTGAPTGTGYVVFGKTSNTTVALSSLGSGGFVMNGKDASGAVGYSVSAAGDVNGDGLADLIVGAPYTGGTGPAAGKGYTYVVFGTTSSSAISLSSITGGAGGFKITGACTADNSGYSVSAAGDVNGDGYADLIVGAPNADSSGVVSSGSSYVIFGGSTSGDVTLSSALASGGFAINGTGASSYSGWSVSAAGDVNGDGLADVIVGAKGSNSSAGASYVVFGKSTTAAVSLATVASATPSGGFVIYGQSASDESGLSVSNAGDLNGDGLSDLLVGAHYADPTTGTNAGRTYVVYGKTASTAVYLSAIAAGTGGFVINGQCASDESGISVSAGGDINGDGMADLIVGANNADPTSGSNAGRTYVIFGSTSGALGVGTAVDWVGTSADETRTSTGSQTLVGGAGNDTLTSSASTGADVLYGGQGNDTFVVTAAMVTALQSNFGAGGNITQLARIDGGTGVDILQLAGGTASAGVSLNLTAIKNAGVDSSRLESIEVIDLSADASLSGGKGNQLTLGLSDVLDMTGMNVFNSSTSGIGSSGGTALAQSVMKHQLMIWGDSSDYVSIGVSATGWVKSSTNTAITYTYTDIGGTSHTHTMVAYNYYSATVYAQLLIDQAIVNATGHLT
ncbi:S-layer family protein, partial [Limnohabitans sp. JirII-31]|uniref:beta strand repeat-containing protein n=1 Tax=Limnohabitans sp. JirII-31 TaxID=1977908 RepID=UPI000CCAA171